MKFLVVLTSAALVFVYAYFQRKNIINLFEERAIIEEVTTLPDFHFDNFSTDQMITKESVLKNQKILMLHFWATWCAPCEEEFPELIKFAQKYKDQIEFLFVAVNDDKNKIKKFLSRFKEVDDFTFALESKGETENLFNTSKLPETYVFNSQQRLLKKFIGPQDWESDYIKYQLERWK